MVASPGSPHGEKTRIGQQAPTGDRLWHCSVPGERRANGLSHGRRRLRLLPCGTRTGCTCCAGHKQNLEPHLEVESWLCPVEDITTMRPAMCAGCVPGLALPPWFPRRSTPTFRLSKTHGSQVLTLQLSIESVVVWVHGMSETRITAGDTCWKSEESTR